MELLFLVIFLFFIVLNVVIGLASSRAKKRRAAMVKPPEEGSPGVSEKDRQGESAETPDEKGGQGGFPYFLQEQNADTLVQSLYTEAEEEDTRAVIAEVKAPLPVEKRTEEKPAAAAPAEKPEQRPYYPRQAPRRLDVSQVEEERTAPLRPLKTPQEKVETHPSRPGWEQVEKLPTLQKAVILSEILGSPRALSERTHSH